VGLIHPDVVDESAERYIAYLDRLTMSQGLHAAGQETATRLRESIRNGLALREALTPECVPFTASLLDQCESDDRAALINQWSLGMGSDAAPTIVMGTEHAFNVDNNSAGLALESCGSALLWLHDGGAELAAWVAQDSKWVRTDRRSYHRHPHDHYTVPAGHTWPTVARVLSVPLTDLGDHAYQIERSAHPSPAAAAGRRPTGDRRAFLVRLVSAFRSSARVLLLHGKTNSSDAQWIDCNRSLSQAFLHQESLGQPDEWMVGKGLIIRRWAIADRAVFHTRALNGGALAWTGAGDEYVAKVATLVASAL
jgi:hypothetical protein